MKKLLSIILAVLILSSVVNINFVYAEGKESNPIFSENNTEPTEEDISIPDSSSEESSVTTTPPDTTITQPPIPTPEITSVKFEKQKYNVEKGKKINLPLTVNPTNGNINNILWKSTDESVATVDNMGQVSAKKTGTTIIIACSENRCMDACIVNVIQKAKSISVKSYVHLYKGKSTTLKVTIKPSDTSNKALAWKSTNRKVAVVYSNGRIKAIGKGCCYITATAKDGSRKSAKCFVVVGNLIKKIKLNITKANVNIGKTVRLKASVTPKNAVYKSLKWSTSNKEIAKVNAKGTVKGIRKGTAIIKATAKDGSKKYAKCKITVRQPVTKITLNKSKASVVKGRTIKLKATCSPSNANNKSVKWSTSNKKIATVSAKGIVKGIKRGTAIIKATAKDGSKKYAKCKVTVTLGDDDIVNHSQVVTEAFVTRLCNKLNAWYKKYGATIDPSIMKYDSWYCTDTTGWGWIDGMPKTPENLEYFKDCGSNTFNEIYYTCLKRYLTDASGDAINNGQPWNGIKGYDYDSYYKWIDNITKKEVLDGDLNGWSELLPNMKVYCYPEKMVDPDYGTVNYIIKFYNW